VSAQPPGKNPKKRPWYLVFALVLSAMFGACSWNGSCERVMVYRNQVQLHATPITKVGPTDEERAVIRQREQELYDARDASRKVGLPLAIVASVLGAAIVFFTARLIANRAGAKPFLMQVLAVQFVIAAVAHVALADFDRAEQRLRMEHTKLISKGVKWMQVPPGEEAEQERLYGAMRHVILALRGVATLGMLVAFSRKRTADFFDSALTAIENERS
jgi:hypothetical protein